MNIRPHILALLLLLAPLPAAAQKYASVNTDYILKSIPDYANAQQRLDKYVEGWQKELSDQVAELEAMRVSYEQESYLLPDNLKRRRQEEIKSKEQEIHELQQQRFGAGGDLDKKRAELLQPVLNRVYSMIERVANEKNYAMVFDKSGSPTLLFVNKKYDISNEVLELLGYKPEAATEQPQGQQQKDRRPSNPEMRRPERMPDGMMNRSDRRSATPMQNKLK
ncbi:MAG: OmpH family outer membrane protein [Bacteroidales bacterium]|nr:OmpH family outer membrane protein [Bacteroidales bacterium]